MIVNEIKIDKSIQSSRLIYKQSVFLKLFEIPFFIIWVALPITFGFFSSKEIDFNKIGTVVIPTIFFILFILVAYSYIQSNKLKRQKNLLKNNNKKIIEDYLNNLSKRREWSFLENTDKLKIINIPFRDLKFWLHKEIVIIYDNEDMLINCSTYLIGYSRLPLTKFCNKYLENKLIKKIEMEIKTQHNRVDGSAIK